MFEPQKKRRRRRGGQHCPCPCLGGLKKTNPKFTYPVQNGE